MSKVKPIPKRFDIWLINLDPTIGAEIKKTRPCIIISPDEISALSAIIAAPLTSKGFDFPIRIKFNFKSKDSLVLLDQIRAVDKKRLIKKLGVLDSKTAEKVCGLLVEMFSH